MVDRMFYFDIASILVLLPIIVALFTKKLYKSASSKIFLALILSVILAAGFEIISCFPRNISVPLLWVSTMGYFTLRNLMPALYLLYILVITDDFSKLRKDKWKAFLLSIPYIITFVLILTTYQSEIIFRFDINANGDYLYRRGDFMWILYVSSGLYLLIGIVSLFRYRLFFNSHQFVSIIAIFPLTIAAVISQAIVPWMMVELFSTALGIAIIATSLEAPDELIDSKTGLNANKQFFNTVKKAGTVKKDLYILLIKIENYSEIFNLMDFDTSSKFVKATANRFNKSYRKFTRNYRTFFIEDGLFAATFLKKENAKIVAQNIYDDLKNYKKLDYTPKFSLCLIDLINDFSDFSSFVAFINNYYSKKMFDNNFVNFEDYKNEKSFVIQNNIDMVIEEGLKNNEFEVYYQPIFDVKSNSFKSAEALIRLNSNKYGFVGPGFFINHAEENGKIIQIDNFVFEEVFKFISSDEFKSLGLEYIEINLSMIDCVDSELVNRIKSLMSKYDIKPENINLEITESINVDYESIDTNIKKLCSLGISFSLDDYGTGFSNIERFTTLPLEIVKIDKSLADKYNDKSMEQVLINTFNMINGLNRKAVVEGVEDENQAMAFMKFGCDFIQGYYYSKPLPKDKFIEFIKEKNLTQMSD